MSERLPDALADDWFVRRTISTAGVTNDRLLTSKRAKNQRVSVCLPALNESETIGTICRCIRSKLMGADGLVDELIVIDSGSTDDTRHVARSEGAAVYVADEIMPERNIPGGGKGDSLWKSLTVCTGDIVVWLDADTRNFDEHFVTRLLHPLLTEDDVLLVKGFYERPLEGEPAGASGGARVTELVVRPLLSLFYPALTGVVQPLSGEYAGRKAALMELPFFTGYGVEIGLLIDLAERFGLDALAQVDLGRRVHRNRTTLELGQSAFQVIQVMLMRFEELGRLKLPHPLPDALTQFWPTDEGPEARTTALTVIERPPLSELR